MNDRYNKKQMNAVYLLEKIINKQFEVQSEKNIWNNSLFENIEKLKNDRSGKVGELFIFELCKYFNFACEYKEDINTTDGYYDIIINGKKVEIKTARIGLQKGFQHDGLKDEGCDFYLFLDILPNYIYITIFQKFDLTKKNEIIGRKPHLRDKTNGVYKFDFGENNIKKSIKNKTSIEINKNTNIFEIFTFFNKNFE